MSYKILLPLDGSPLSESVFPLLRLVTSKISQPEVELVRSFEPPSTVYLLPDLAIPTGNPLSDGSLGELVLEYLRTKTEELDDVGEVSSQLVVGPPADKILELSENFDLVVMTSHGGGGLGRWLMGSVATKVLRGLTVPVLLATGDYIESEQIRSPKLEKILVAMDGSEPAERALEQAADLASRFGAKLVLYQSVHQVSSMDKEILEANRLHLIEAQEYLRSKADALDVAAECVVKGTTTSTGIVDLARERGVDMIAMGSHGKSGLARWMLGSATEQVLQRAPCPVWVTH